MPPLLFFASDSSDLCYGDADSSDDAGGGGFFGAEAEQFHGGVERVGAEDETVGLITDVPEGEGVEKVDGVDVGTRGIIGCKRVVVAVDDNDGARLEDWLHWPGLGGSEADGEKALPVAASKGAARAELIKSAGGQVNKLEGGTLIHNGGVKRGGVCDERHGGSLFGIVFGGSTSGLGQKVFNAQQLSGENPVECREAELALAMDKIRQVRRAQAGLAGEERTGKQAAINTASYFDAEPLVKLRKIHLWNFVFELHALIKQFADCKAI